MGLATAVQASTVGVLGSRCWVGGFTAKWLEGFGFLGLETARAHVPSKTASQPSRHCAAAEEILP